MKGDIWIRLSAGTMVIAILGLAGIRGGEISIQGAATGEAVTGSRSISVVVLKDAKGRASGYVDPDLSAVNGVLNALERYGAKLDLRAGTKRGVDSLQVMIDGRRVGSLVTECKECEPIVFEY